MSASSLVGLVPLDPWDEVFHSLYEDFGGAGIGAAVLHLRGRVEAEPLRAALSCLQRRHPKLRARIVEREGRRGFDVLESPPPIPFEFKAFETDDIRWKEECSRLMSAEIDPAVDPLGRVVVLHGPTREQCVVILLLHHSIGDGRSGIRLVDDLLTYYDEAARGGAPPSVVSLPIVQSPRAKVSGGLLMRLRVMTRLYRRRRDNRKADWTQLPHADDVPPHRLWTHVVFSERDTLTLARRCRKERTTVYGALFAAATRALVTRLGEPHARFKCRVPIDIRGKLEGLSGPVTDHDLGNFIGGYETVYSTEANAPFWELARKIHREVDTFNSADGPSIVYNMIRFVKLPYVPQTLRRGTMLIGSYGVPGIRDRSTSLSLEKLAIGFNNDRVGPSLLIQALVIQRRMNLNLSMVDVPEDFWTYLREEFVAQLRNAIAATAA